MRPGDVPGDRIDRLDVAAKALAAARVDHEQRARGETGQRRRPASTVGSRWRGSKRRRLRLRNLGGHRAAFARPFGEAAVEHRDRHRGRASAASTTAARRTCRCPDRRRRPASSRRCRGGRRARRRLRARAADGGRWSPIFGADRSRSRWANRAPGRCARRYSDSPQASGCARSCRTSTITTRDRRDGRRGRRWR